jgi:carbonic anhydrase
VAEIQKLIDGYRRFHKKYFLSDTTLYEELDKVGQSPKTLVLACSDSRVDPSIISDADPGDIFVVRNVANLVPPYEKDDKGFHGVSAALEFAVRILKVENIVILGHSKCAGVHTLLNPEAVEDSDFIGHWVDIGQPAKEKACDFVGSCVESDALQHACEKEVILLSLKNLMTFPWIQERVGAGSLTLHGWYFRISDGGLQHFNPKTGVFEEIF